MAGCLSRNGGFSLENGIGEHSLNVDHGERVRKGVWR